MENSFQEFCLIHRDQVLYHPIKDPDGLNVESRFDLTKKVCGTCVAEASKKSIEENIFLATGRHISVK